MAERTIIGFLGGGNMATALLRGCLGGTAGYAPADFLVSDPSETARTKLAQAFPGVSITADNAALVRTADVVVLAIKPQLTAPVLGPLRDVFRPSALVISLMAGVSSAALEVLLPPGSRVVRTMPNTPAMVLEGATAIAPGREAKPADVAWTEEFFGVVGKTVVVEERLLDAVTGLSGSGPAYVLMMIEAMADGGVKAGLTRDVARVLAAQTVAGTAKLLLDGNRHPAELRDAVTSPGGTTIAGLHVLENAGVRGAFISAIEAASRRSAELGRAFAESIEKK